MKKKPGRNDPCPCGSGKKAKQCHGVDAAPADETPAGPDSGVVKAFDWLERRHPKAMRESFTDFLFNDIWPEQGPAPKELDGDFLNTILQPINEVWFASGDIRLGARHHRVIDLVRGALGAQLSQTELSFLNELDTNWHRLYRVLESDPGNPLAESFAFGAGEMLLLDKLEEKLQKDALTLGTLHKERDELIAVALRGGAAGQRAERTLQTKHRDDPKVLSALGWTPSEELRALRRLNADGADAAKRGKHVIAARNFRQVLGKARDTETRRAAIVGVQNAERELARAAAVAWRQAVLAQARGDQAAARDAFAQVMKADEHNVSARLHLGRIPADRR